MKATLKFRAAHHGTHVHVRVYAAVGGMHLAYCGQLTMRPDEWRALDRQLRRGPLAARTVEIVDEPDEVA